MVIQDVNGRIVTPRTPGQKIVRLVWNITKGMTSLLLTLTLCAMLPQLAMGFFVLLGLGWFIKNGANVAMGAIKGVVYMAGAVVASIWKGL